MPPTILDAVARLVQPAAHHAASVQDVAMAEVLPWGQSLIQALLPQIVGMSMMGKPCGDVDFDEHGHSYACEGAARAQCSTCNRPVCLGHGFFSGVGECVCYSCARTAKAAATPGHGAPTRSRRASAARPAAHAPSPPAGPPPGWRPGPFPGASAGGQAPPQAAPPQEKPPAGVAPYSREAEVRARIVLGLEPEATFGDAKAAARKLWAQCHPDRATDKTDHEWRQKRFNEIGAALDFLKAHVWKESAA